MSRSDLFTLARALGAKNLTQNAFSANPVIQDYLTQRQRSQGAEDFLQSTRTPLGAVSGGIALYLQRKRENKALEQLNQAYEAEQARAAQEKEARMQQRESLIQTLPEDKRPLANFLDDEALQKHVAESLSPTKGVNRPVSLQEYEYYSGLSPEEQKKFLNLKRDTQTPKTILDQENTKLRNEKLKKELSGEIPPKPLPVQALKLQNEALDIIGSSNGINADLNALTSQLEGGKLDLGPVENLKSQALNKAGLSTEQSRNFSSFKSTLEKLRNESLRLNKGVQTEGDAVRAWNEIVSDLNDEKLVAKRLREVQKINKRGADLQKLQVDQIRANYGSPPLDYSQFENRPAALGNGGSSNNMNTNSLEGRTIVNKQTGQRLIMKNGQWQPI